jgi:hypothetical protein
LPLFAAAAVVAEISPAYSKVDWAIKGSAAQQENTTAAAMPTIKFLLIEASLWETILPLKIPFSGSRPAEF